MLFFHNRFPRTGQHIFLAGHSLLHPAMRSKFLLHSKNSIQILSLYFLTTKANKLALANQYVEKLRVIPIMGQPAWCLHQ